MSGIRPSLARRHRLPYVLTLLKPWSCTPMWLTCPAITRTVASRPTARWRSSPVASNCSSADPYWKPWVHSVQPRAVYCPSTVNTGEGDPGGQVRSIESIFAADASQSRSILDSRSAGASPSSIFMLVTPKAGVVDGHSIGKRLPEGKECPVADRRAPPAVTGPHGSGWPASRA